MPVWGSGPVPAFLSEYQSFSCSFLCLPKETNQRKAPCVSCPAIGGRPGVYAPHGGVLLDAAGALQTRFAQTVQIPFSAASPVLGCVPMGISFFPHFVLPPSSRSKGSPQRQDWLGCLRLLLEWTRGMQPTKALDLFCGMGNFSLPLAMQGWQVTGMDMQRSTIRSAMRNAEAAGGLVTAANSVRKAPPRRPDVCWPKRPPLIASSSTRPVPAAPNSSLCCRSSSPADHLHLLRPRHPGP